ncbi:shikimate kinase [Eubacteriales bacterium OttesenSCG-928-M02]|nr:shikimate kinase [Eubacteriales bacterium OttesenSCG-928-M02]
MRYSAIHITGASGGGVSTLGKAICEKYGYWHMDTDDYFWVPTDPPFTQKREKAELIQTLIGEIHRHSKFVLSGSVTDWGDPLIPYLDLVILVETPEEVRISRLREREYNQFGKRILPGGDMAEEHEAFIEWARQYDTGDESIRSRRLHEAFLKKLSCPWLEVDGTKPIFTLMEEIENFLPSMGKKEMPPVMI